MNKAPGSTQRLRLAGRKLRQWYELNRSFLAESLGRYQRTAENRDYLALEQRFFQQYAPCFVLSTGRCGSEFLTHLFALSPQLEVRHKPVPDLRFHKQELRAADPRTRIAVARATRFEPMFAAFLGGRTWVETNNAATFLAPALAEMFPRSRFIHLVRHPAGFARSGMRRGWYTGDVETDIGILRNDGDPEWDGLDRLARIGWLWNETQRFIRDTLRPLDSARYRVVRSEDLFADPSVAEDLFRFLELPPPDRARLARRMRSPANSQLLGEFPRYEQWSAEQRRSLARSVKLHSEYGYELDES